MTPSGYLFVRCVRAHVKVCIQNACVFVCAVNTSEKKKREKERRRRENLGKYIFLITVSEVNAAYLGVPTAAGGGEGGGGGRGEEGGGVI